MITRKWLPVLGVLLFSFSLSAQRQFTVDLDLRSRFEYRHGFGTLFPDGVDPAAFVTNRARLALGYKHERFALKFDVQDVSTWGDTRQINPVDGNDSFMLFQAWGEVYLDEHWTIKAGRQVLSYDDERILGGLDWAMQGRFHDALLVRFKNETVALDVGGAFNQERISFVDTDFGLQGAFTYKAMQFAHLKKAWERTKGSFLFLSTGFQAFEDEEQTVTDGVYYTLTSGTYWVFPIGNVNMSASAYYQFGEAAKDTDLSAYQIAADATYKPSRVMIGAGFEILSGTDQDGDSKNKSFFPLYGTNHKFNGYMDYFYVGNHANNVGLNDFYAKSSFDIGTNGNILVKAHYFGANAKLTDNASSYLGTEVDLMYSHLIVKNVRLNLGYSHMFASSSMSLVKNGITNNNTNNWAWVQLTFTPRVFTHEMEKKD